MEQSSPRALSRPIHKAFLAIAFCLLLANVASGQRYREGDTVQNFTLIDRATGNPVSLSDFEGKIVFLEWFAYWCPFCRAAAEQVRDGVVTYYKGRGGNVNGIPVMHVGINLEPFGANQTNAFISEFRIEQVLEDTNRGLANRFQSGGQPIFAIINGVKNSPSHNQWELIYSRLGFGELVHPITDFRAAIDSVQAPLSIQPPAITSQPDAARLATGSNIVLSSTASGEGLSYQWRKDGAPLPGKTATTLSIESATLADAGSYTIVVSNDGGAVESSAASVEVLLSLADYLAAAGLSGPDLEAQADPDLDGFANAFEYLAQTNPNNAGDRPNATLQFTQANGVPAIRIQFTSSPDTIGVSLTAHLWSYPAGAGNLVRTLPIGESSDLLEPFPNGATTYLARLVATTTSGQ